MYKWSETSLDSDNRHQITLTQHGIFRGTPDDVVRDPEFQKYINNPINALKDKTKTRANFTRSVTQPVQPAPKSFSTNSTIKDPADWRFERIADVMLELQKLGISPVVFFELFCSSGKANALFPNNCYKIDDDSFTKLWIDKPNLCSVACKAPPLVGSA